MRKALIVMVLASPLLLLLLHVPTVDIPAVFAQTPDGEHNCPSSTAIPPYIGTGTSIFSPNQNLCMPELAPVGGSLGPLAFIVQGVEPGVRVDSQGTIYVDSIRGVPGGADLWRWDQSLGPISDGGPNSNGTLPFRYEGQPDNCGILTNGCANNVGSLTNLGIAPGGGGIPSAQAGLTASFGFVAQNDKPNASLSYHDDGALGGAIDVHSVNTSVPTVTFSGNCGSFKGDAKVNHQPGYTYTAEGCDNGEPGAGKDTFAISVSGPNFVYKNSGTLTNGNIQIHKE